MFCNILFGHQTLDTKRLNIFSFKRFKDDEPLVTKCHTENYNGYFNAYVPEARVEVIQLDDIRHCIIFHHINESDSGVYVVRAVNALGEAVCEAEIEVNI